MIGMRKAPSERFHLQKSQAKGGKPEVSTKGEEGSGTTHPQHFLRGGSILFKDLQDPEGILRCLVGRNALGELFHLRLKLALIHDGRAAQIECKRTGGRSCENRSLSDLPVVSLSVDVEQAREKFGYLPRLSRSAHQ